MELNTFFELGPNGFWIWKIVLELEPNGREIGKTMLKIPLENFQINLKC
jgi:hypothetical protein